jgi:hypothetical protein
LISNPNNTFKEHFITTLFKGSPCTSNWNITLNRLEMSAGFDPTQIYDTVATFNQIYGDTITIYSVTLNCTETIFSTDVINYYISTDNVNWQQIYKGVTTTLSVPGTKLYLMIEFLGQGGNQTYIEDLSVAYG